MNVFSSLNYVTTSIEVILSMLIGCALFRLDIDKKTQYQVWIVGFIIGIITKLEIEYFDLETTAMFLQFILLFCGLWFIFNFSFLRTVLLTFISYVAFAIFQNLFAMSLIGADIVTIEQMTESYLYQDLFQVVEITLLSFITKFIKKKKIGFSLPERINTDSRESQIVLPLMLLELVLMTYFWYELRHENTIHHKSSAFMIANFLLILIAVYRYCKKAIEEKLKVFQKKFFGVS